MQQIEWDEGTDAARNACRHLPVMMTGYFALVRNFLEKHPSPPKLHRLRLATKRLRYTLELFRPCYGPGLETRIAELREVQKLLGDVNDYVAGRQLLDKAMKSSSEGSRVRKFLERRTEKAVHKFSKHWSEVFDGPGREQWWTGYLSRGARRHRSQH